MLGKKIRIEEFCESHHTWGQSIEYYFLYIKGVNRKLSYYLCCFSLRREDILLLHIIACEILGQCLKGGLKYYYTKFSWVSKILLQNSLFLISLYLKDLISWTRIHQANGRNCFLQLFVYKNSIVDFFFAIFLLILLILCMCWWSIPLILFIKKWLIFRMFPLTLECHSEISMLK